MKIKDRGNKKKKSCRQQIKNYLPHALPHPRQQLVNEHPARVT
jgi:hypothetical protein